MEGYIYLFLERVDQSISGRTLTRVLFSYRCIPLECLKVIIEPPKSTPLLLLPLPLLLLDLPKSRGIWIFITSVQSGLSSEYEI